MELASSAVAVVSAEVEENVRVCTVDIGSVETVEDSLLVANMLELISSL